MAACRTEAHHRIPRCLLGSLDRATAGDLDGPGLQAWLDWEEEAFRYGVDPDISRDDLIALIESSTVSLPYAAHRVIHADSGDFARWGGLRRPRNAQALRQTMVRAPGAEALEQNNRSLACQLPERGL